MAIGAGCADHTPAPVAPSDVVVRIGKPCPALASGEAPSVVFLEVVDTRLDSANTDLSRVVASPLPIHGVGRLVASLGETSNVPWGACMSDPCQPLTSTLMITPQLAESDAKTISISVQLVLEGDAGPPRTKVLETRDQEPVLLRFDDGTPKDSMAWIVTPYLMSSRERVRQAMACKVADAHGAHP